ncbi:hypothetical protein TrLO_g1449 [Triparma laevis f. longispina]|uniref:Uncharacterized protein n=1 Tax=Triparma laevis f. longispina TaxID=1714387 RepID=A0A9W7EI22_9STRA|nr:hypothetical protein TrLO_g1449 [Triparma laevis f. longispina]
MAFKAALSALLLLCITYSVAANSIMGIDMGSQTFKVGLVRRGAPLEIVVNMHSKRKTETMVLFDQGSRFFGADASSLQTRKPLATPSMMSLLLGRDSSHPSVTDLASKSYPVPFSFNETRNGMEVEVQKAGLYTPEELMAMVLGHARDFTSAFTSDGKATRDPLPKDAVLTVPSFYTQNERVALLTAAELAGLNVLSLIDENTAAALHYGMDRVVPAGEKETVMFYNLGATSTQVSIVEYSSYTLKEAGKNKTVGAFEVKSKAWDATCGGTGFDDVIVNYLADEFNKQWKKGDVKEVPRAMTKLRVQAQKVKEVLSANNKIPIYMEGLHDDRDFKSSLTREEFEKMASDLFDRSSVPITKALEAAGVKIEDIDAIELVGGGMRVPKVQKALETVTGDKELGMHINSDESMALGAAFHGANISTAFRVRKVGMTDVTMFPVGVRLSSLESESGGGWFGKKKDKKKDDKEDEEAWSKQATIFKEFGKMGVKKTIAFTHDENVAVEVVYEESEYLPTGTSTDIVKYNITGVEKFAADMVKKGLGAPKVSIQFELSGSGIVKLLKAEATVEETVEVEVEEEVEDPDAVDEEEEEEEAVEEEEVSEEKTKEEEPAAEEGEEKKENDAEEAKTDDAEETAEDEEKVEEESKEEAKKETKKKPKKKIKKKKTKTIKVMKEQKKVHKEVLEIKEYYTSKIAPYSSTIMKESVEKLLELAAQDKIRHDLEEAKNALESKVYSIKNYVTENEDSLDAVSTSEQREELVSLASATEDWLYDDGYDSEKEAFISKLAELEAPAESMFFRLAELTKRPVAVQKCKERLEKMRALMTKWETTMEQVTEEERADVFDKIEKVEKWLEEKLEAQGKLEKWEDVAFKSSEVAPMSKSLEMLVTRLSKKPKPKVEKKNETEAEEVEGEGEEDNLDDKEEGESEGEGEGQDEAPAAEEESEEGDEL